MKISVDLSGADPIDFMDPPLLLNERYNFILAHYEAFIRWRGPYH